MNALKRAVTFIEGSSLFGINQGHHFLFSRILLPSSAVIQRAGLKKVELPVNYDWVEFPERQKLKPLERTPNYGALRPPKYQKKLYYMRGPELVHNQLIHKQYGIVALQPGRLRHGHFEMMRNRIGRQLTKDMFAIWRVDPPWQAISRKTQGSRMGAGKGAIDHYVTPVKHGRIILEVGGRIEFKEVYWILKGITDIFPFKAKPVCQEWMVKEAEDRILNEKANLNPYTFKYIVQNNLGNSHNWISTYDRKWFGEHR